MASKQQTSRGRKQDRARVAGGQDYEVRYQAKKSGRSKAAVKEAVKKVGNSRKMVERRLSCSVPSQEAWQGSVLDEALSILVVEDDQLIQSVVEEALSEGGFVLNIAASGEEAMTLMSQTNSRYLALITDITLGGTMNGWQIAKHARELDPAFPVIYITGGNADQWAVEGVPDSVLLIKPFAPAQLVTAISQLLNDRRSPPTAPA
jgi:CheY-like chemotaxis protein